MFLWLQTDKHALFCIFYGFAGCFASMSFDVEIWRIKSNDNIICMFMIFAWLWSDIGFCLGGPLVRLSSPKPRHPGSRRQFQWSRLELTCWMLLGFVFCSCWRLHFLFVQSRRNQKLLGLDPFVKFCKRLMGADLGRSAIFPRHFLAWEAEEWHVCAILGQTCSCRSGLMRLAVGWDGNTALCPKLLGAIWFLPMLCFCMWMTFNFFGCFAYGALTHFHWAFQGTDSAAVAGDPNASSMSHLTGVTGVAGVQCSASNRDQPNIFKCK